MFGAMTDAREASPLEYSEWQRFNDYYRDVLTKKVMAAKTAAEIANQAQAVVDKHGIKGYVFDAGDLDKVQSLLARANLIGRYISGIEAGKYAIRLKDGDIQILAASDMNPEEYSGDIYPSLGGWILYVLAAGAIICAGLWLVSKIIEDDAEKIQKENEQRIIAANIEMMKQPEAVRRDWIDMLKASEQPAREVGILEKLFGSESTKTIGAGIAIAIVAIAALFAFSKRGK